MSICPMKKVLITGHKASISPLIKDLQKAALIHIVNISEKPLPGDFRFKSDPEQKRKLKDAKIFLEAYSAKKTLLDKLLNPFHILNEKSFNDIIRSYDIDSLLDSILHIKEKITDIENEKSPLIAQNIQLNPWKNIETPLPVNAIRDRVYFASGTIGRADYEKLLLLDNAEIRILDRHKDRYIILAAAAADNAEIIKKALQKLNFDEAEFNFGRISPADKFEANEARITELDNEKIKLVSEAKSYAENYYKLAVFLEHHGNIEKGNRIFDHWISTKNAYIISGWVRSPDIARLSSIISSYEDVILEETVPDKNETPPVAFENRKIFSPFQFITRLYNYPAYGSVDAAPVTSLFFVVFFALCLTDAGYGLVLSIAAFIGLKKFKTGRDLLWILFWGGIFTIFAGILTGGIFGDLFREEAPFIHLPFLTSLREKMMWFDPMKDPMVFFRLVLLLGVIHVFTGLIIGFFVKLKMKNTAGALVDNGTWILILASIFSLIFSSEISIKMSLVSSASPPLNDAFAVPSYAVLASMSAVIILFGARDEKSPVFRIIIGFLKLVVLSGIFSYMGDILSYIRLMALGMVTAGIGMAVNTIAFMLADIPVAGYILTAVVLVFGHTFNLVINLLGGFVHTLRLQYVEFYSKFFISGGKAFAPFSYDGKYVKIID